MCINQLCSAKTFRDLRETGPWALVTTLGWPNTVFARALANAIQRARKDHKNKFNKLTSVFYASVLLLMINCVITLSKWLWNHEPQAIGSAVNFDDVMTKFIISKRTDA